jgi:hypothetical protein
VPVEVHFRRRAQVLDQIENTLKFSLFFGPETCIPWGKVVGQELTVEGHVNVTVVAETAVPTLVPPIAIASLSLETADNGALEGVARFQSVGESNQG